jgi:glutathione S-transferase
MPEYKVTYFGSHGRASAICLLLAKAGADWEKSSPTPAEWKELKPTLGLLPVVTLADGTVLKDSIPTSRYLAGKFGFYPQDAIIAHRIDVVTAHTGDTFNALAAAMFAGDQKDTDLKKWMEVTLPAYFAAHEEILGKQKWFAGGSLTLADFWAGSLYVDHFTNEGNPNYAAYQGVIKAFPNFIRFGEDFRAENKAHLDSRKPSPM